MTLTLSSSSRALCWPGDSSSSATRTSKPVSRLGREQLLGLALADVPVGVDVAAVLPLGAHDLGAGRRRRGRRARPGCPRRPAGVVAGVDGDEEGLLDGRREVDRGRAGLMAGRIPARAQAQPTTRRADGARRPGRAACASAASMARSTPARARNQVRWRRAKATLRRASSSRSPPRGRARRRGRPSLAVADGARTPAGPGRSASRRASRLVEEARRRTGPRRARAIQAPVRARVGDVEPEPRHGRRVADAARAAARRRASVAISSARTTRRGLRRSVARGAAPGASPRSRRDEGGEPVAGQVGLERGAHGRVRGQRVDGEAPRDGPQPEARCRRPGWRPRRAAASAGQRAARVRRRSRRRENGWSGSTRSRPWWGTPRALLERRLGRPDVQAAVDLARVGGDDLGRAARRAGSRGRARSRGRSCRSRWAAAMTSEAAATRSRRRSWRSPPAHARRRAARTARRRRSATSTSCPTSSGGPGEVDELVLARAAEQAHDAGGQGPANGSSPASVSAAAAASGASSSWSWARGRRDRVHEDLDVGCPSQRPVALEADRLLDARAAVEPRAA